MLPVHFHLVCPSICVHGELYRMQADLGRNPMRSLSTGSFKESVSFTVTQLQSFIVMM